MRFVVAAAVVVTAFSCERELLPLDPSLVIVGYEVRGTVLDRFGNPISGVDVSLDFTLDAVDAGPEPQRTYTVPLPGETITISVLARDGRVVFTESAGFVPPGEFEYLWNRRDNGAQFVPPGLYEVRYLSGAAMRLSYAVLVSGTTAAVTDSAGRYDIGASALPVGYYPVPEYSLSGQTYFGNSRVTAEVILGFSVEGLREYRTIALQKDRVVIYDIRLY